jgi:hypothetical protein
VCALGKDCNIKGILTRSELTGYCKRAVRILVCLLGLQMGMVSCNFVPAGHPDGPAAARLLQLLLNAWVYAVRPSVARPANALL